MERHDTTFEIIEANSCEGARAAYVSNRVRLLTGPYMGRLAFYSYCPRPGFQRERAERLGLATTDDDIPNNVGKRFDGRVTVHKYRGMLYNYIDAFKSTVCEVAA